MSEFNLKDILTTGLKALQDDHKSGEGAKVGTLRAGNTGALAMGGVIGKCHRLTYLRYKGINVEEIADNRELMFAAGRSNEDIWIEVLKKSWKGTILREEEIPSSWTTSNGIAVTGRPDIVLCENGTTILSKEEAKEIDFYEQHVVEGSEFPIAKPVLGLELKLVSSIWTARDVAFNYKPKLPHLLQAAHYAWQIGVSFKLMYTSRADFAVGSGWEQKTFPKNLTEEQQAIVEINKDGKIKKILPFMIVYDLEFTDKGQLRYKREGVNEEWTHTLVTISGIREYYETVAAMDTNKNLGARPLDVDAKGEKAGYSACNYCPMQATCDKHEGNFDEWLDAATKVLPHSADKE